MRVSCNCQMEIATRVAGRWVSFVGTVCSSKKRLVSFTEVGGGAVCNMERVTRPGRMDLNTLESLLMVARRAAASTYGRTNLSILVSGSTI